ncbi:M20/M25/M40 family metallo-hydrolase [Paenibacillus oralis]|uniref:M20/M25/M40 family metallo-hydrolase n=1 Tax=Paenibacillus oralis TaxID=2490856 RepID=UPI001FE3FFCE|nr:M20/M25/M40 family metallo-hydrolase [Paenibacillus oralis]
MIEAGFQVEKGISGLPTSFRATWEGATGEPMIALLAEYDALPGIGHACGHNLIGTATIGAALALKDAYPQLPGKIVVLGTPAEEECGGKIIMCQNGVFDEVDAAMMVHS